MIDGPKYLWTLPDVPLESGHGGRNGPDNSYFRSDEKRGTQAKLQWRVVSVVAWLPNVKL